MNVALNVIAVKTLIRKEMIRVMRIWVQTIVPPAITMTLYFIIFGNLIGRRIGTMDGFDYMQYIAPGLIMMSVITNSYGNVVSSFFGAKFGRHLEDGYRTVLHATAGPASAGDDFRGASVIDGFRARRFHQCHIREEIR
jgi:ABC-type multidrug transport system permease subunit